MNKDDLVKRIDVLLSPTSLGDKDFEIRIQEMFHGALDIMIILYSPTSIQLQNFIKEEETIRQHYVGQGGAIYREQLTRGVLKIVQGFFCKFDQVHPLKKKNELL